MGHNNQKTGNTEKADLHPTCDSKRVDYSDSEERNKKCSLPFNNYIDLDREAEHNKGPVTTCILDLY